MGMDSGKIRIDEEATITLSSFVLEIGRFDPNDKLTILRGPNGCGKSTLLRAIAGTVPLSQGRRIASSDLRLGFVPQNYRDSLLPWLSAISNLALLGNDPAPMIEVLTQMGMSANDFGKRPYQLSGGQCQRLALVRECHFRPHLLLLDEPFAALDVHALERAGELVRDAITCGSKAIIATHDPLPESLGSMGSTEVSIVRISDDIARVGEVA